MVKVVISLILLIDVIKSTYNGIKNKRTEELQNVLDDLEGKDRLIQKQLDMASVIQRGILPGRSSLRPHPWVHLQLEYLRQRH